MKRIEQLKTLVKPFYPSTDPAHNWSHILRVSNLAQVLAREEKSSEAITLAATLCHDLVNLPKNDPKRSEASTLSAEAAAPLLRECGFTQSEVEWIQSAIISHSYSKNLKPSSLEAAIVQDADRLDALGAIGILRCASVSTQFGSDFFDIDDFWAENRELDDKKFMIDHYQVKLFKLQESMNTLTAKKIAQKRIDFMKLFLSNLHAEVFDH
ncbi:MAG: HD domain-containing protein [Candidatus Caldatribacteriota bacterium]